tara:strand:+ start:884 stop:1123 length:240 start_codon:yes stop_codon:yes gene_type:complete
MKIFFSICLCFILGLVLRLKPYRIMTQLGLEKAYAGPCGDAGCDGKPGYCGTVTVIKVFKWRATKDCTGSNDIEGPAFQ